MSLKMSKENICINKIIGQKEETFLVQNDEIVPDIKPDVLNIISSNGTICIYKKEIQDGKIKFDGCIYIYTMYVADDETGSIKSITSTLDFSKTIDMDGIKENMQLKSQAEIKSIDCKILNGRKISLQATVKIKVLVYSNENVEIVQDIESITDLQKLNKTYNMNSLLGSGSTKVYAKDTIQINTEDNLSEIVKVKVNIINREEKVSYNKVLAKSDAEVKIVYITEDGRINSVTSKIPVMGFIDIPNVVEENICDITYELKNILIKPNNVDDHSIYVEMEIGIDCFVYESKSIDIIEDLYSPTVSLTYNQNNVRMMQNRREIEHICNIRKQENVSDIGKGRICDVDVRPSIINSQISDGRISYEGEIELIVLYLPIDGNRIESKTIIEPFSFNIVDDNVNSNNQMNTNIDITTQDFIVMPDESIDVKIDLVFKIEITEMKNINIISDVDEDSNLNKERCSIVIYYTKPGDTLWNIAKRFGSTVDDIARINDISDPDVLVPNEQLFIPR